MTGLSDRERRKSRAELEKIFGDDLPTVTKDEQTVGQGDEGHSNADMRSDEWFLENRPPHHE
jgi:hypothetical protein